jgi:hypothetical protein
MSLGRWVLCPAPCGGTLFNVHGEIKPTKANPPVLNGRGPGTRNSFMDPDS